MKNVITLLTFFMMAVAPSLSASGLKAVVNLNGQWKFAIGDDMAWAQRNFNDSDWDMVFAPSKWEDQGYVGYDGYAWYRKTLKLPSTSYNGSLYINLGKIDDVNEVYFNGVRIGQMGKFPPRFETAYNAQLVYPIPEALINFDGENTLAIRIYDETMDGGIVGGPLVIGYDPNVRLLSYDLSGTWRFSFKNYKNCRDTGYDDSGWRTIRVPASWESQGFNNYDGFAWYRKSFELPEELAEQKLYLVLGKIDDKDKVFLNGKQIGEYKDMYDTPFGNGYNGTWQMRRAYKIPKDLLIAKGINTVAVVVYDEGGMGGIHEGPVGLMTKENFEVYVQENEEPDTFYNHISFIGFVLSEIFD
ncbi:MAG: glycoside hydrolase [Bacteroidetes bacterium GWE2_40_63]|nr:MAG: glycoside hydrolase [Bacteroidetes bacterium GWA2_40_14]OFX57140.1 MAG: glycoside hydrolase [Bacteroidetes bacterium GWC2_40_13]OFX73184.1 MAG: glycoside hydrolase [Bacteroidetes bacterium GWD2_40_43]OFX91739.1 MAG: glycoside hydrolase [Bacteroidetes bacterium GWE2_40_63]OFY24549.1 MAG: glycoside hydrolase [Bacteroidetes bacterium GWF2_40_13]